MCVCAGWCNRPNNAPEVMQQVVLRTATVLRELITVADLSDLYIELCGEKCCFRSVWQPLRTAVDCSRSISVISCLRSMTHLRPRTICTAAISRIRHVNVNVESPRFGLVVRLKQHRVRKRKQEIESLFFGRLIWAKNSNLQKVSGYSSMYLFNFFFF